MDCEDRHLLVCFEHIRNAMQIVVICFIVLFSNNSSHADIKEAAKLVNSALIQLVKPEDGVSTLVASLNTINMSSATG